MAGKPMFSPKRSGPKRAGCPDCGSTMDAKGKCSCGKGGGKGGKMPIGKGRY